MTRVVMLVPLSLVLVVVVVVGSTNPGLDDVSQSRHSRLSRAAVNDSKIIDGDDARIEDFPYLVHLTVNLKRGGGSTCVGTIISPYHVLTAAHCVDGASIVYARAGTAKDNSGGRVYVSEWTKAHDLYKASAFDYDVGLIKLKDRIWRDADRTDIVDLPPEAINVPHEREQIYVAGWGRTEEDIPETSPILTSAKIPVVSPLLCKNAYRTYRDERMFCAGIVGEGPCTGDSGAPAVLAGTTTQVGIVSYSRGCARPDNPGVYTRVSSSIIRNWIKRHSGI